MASCKGLNVRKCGMSFLQIIAYLVPVISLTFELSQLLYLLSMLMVVQKFNMVTSHVQHRSTDVTSSLQSHYAKTSKSTNKKRFFFPNNLFL